MLTEQQGAWENRIVGLTYLPANQIHPHPLNPRRHPANQREALRGSLGTIGWAQAVILNRRTNTLVDGHARIEEALSKDETALIPVLEIDVSEAEEAQLLATLDPMSALATYDREVLDSLLREVETGDAAVQKMLSELAETEGVIPPDWSESFAALPMGDKAPFQQMTFTVSDTQAEVIRQAIKIAKGAGVESDDNENSNGNALAKIAEAYLG